MRYLDIYDPRPRIFELRRRCGFCIRTATRREQTEARVFHRIGVYSLKEPSDEAVFMGLARQQFHQRHNLGAIALG